MKRFRYFLSLFIVLLFASSAFAGPFMVLPKRGSAWSGGGGFDEYVVSLLHLDGTDASTTFTDETGKTWTHNLNAKLSTSVKKFGTASLWGGDNSSDFIYTADSDDLNMGTGEFTIDLWFYPHADGQIAQYPHLLNNNDEYWADGSFTLRYSTAGYANKASIALREGTTTKQCGPSTSTQAHSTWHHMAVTRSGATITLFVNGVPEGTITVSESWPVDLTKAGKLTLHGTNTDSGSVFKGYMDEVRISKGIARYTGDFSANLPTAPYSP